MRKIFHQIFDLFHSIFTYIGMKTNFNRIHGSKVDFEPENFGKFRTRRGTVSTLLVPEALMMDVFSDFPIKTTKNGDSIDMRKVLKMLLEKYRGFFAMGFLPFAKKPKLMFQKRGLDLREVKFRPNDDDWAELGIIAYGLGTSRCWLFSFMLELEQKGFEEFLRLPGLSDVVATPGVSRPQQIIRISGRRRFLRRILHFRI